MNYPNIKEGIFVNRPNRFVAYVELSGQLQTCHVKNTGRLRELLVPGAVCYLTESDNPNRKTAYDLVAVEHEGRIVNIDSMAPNAVAGQYLQTLFPEGEIKGEVRFGDSRFDFRVKSGDATAFVEVKGVTLLCEDGIARFPDAPTERGVKHIKELIAAKREGYDAILLFVVAMSGARAVAPNRGTHPAFAEALEEAKWAGVRLLAVDCLVTKEGLWPRDPLPVRVDL